MCGHKLSLMIFVSMRPAEIERDVLRTHDTTQPSRETHSESVSVRRGQLSGRHVEKLSPAMVVEVVVEFMLHLRYGVEELLREM